MAVTDSLGYYVGNPGTLYADLLHRPVVIPNDQGVDYLTTVPFCAECPPTVPAIRRYNGVEFRLAKRGLGRWFGAVSYTYSGLTGNYSGLTSTDPTDAGGGRHAPNLERAFDIPTMTYLPNGQIDEGPLATDRPHTAKIYGFYRQKWAGMETLLGATQAAFQGTPINSCLPVVGGSSACQWAEGRDNFVKFTRAANGDFIKGDVMKDSRTDPYFQTDFFVRHEVRVSKERENMKLALEINLANLFNQRAAVGYYEFAVPANSINPARAKRFQGDPGVDFAKVMSPYNYVDALNGAGAFAGNVPGTNTRIQAPLTVASRYGMPGFFQTARNIRLGLHFSF